MKRQPTRATEATKEIGTAIRRMFPETRFSVWHYNHRFVCRLALCWADGPEEEVVKQAVEAMPASVGSC
jgi:hypothetical protein